MTTRDWSAFERKLSAGKSVTLAALECGIDEKEAREYAQDAAPSAPAALEHNAHEAIEIGIATLREICHDTTEPELRVSAAVNLLRYGAAALKLAQTGRQKRATVELVGQVDLFDVKGDWALKDPAKA